MVGRTLPPRHEDVPFLIPELENVTLHDKGDFATAIKLRIWRWGDYPRLAKWAPISTGVLIRGRQEGRTRRRPCGTGRSNQSDGTSEGLGLQLLALKMGEGVQGSRKARGSSSWKRHESPSQKECSHPRLDFSPVRPFRRLTSGRVRYWVWAVLSHSVCGTVTAATDGDAHRGHVQRCAASTRQSLNKMWLSVQK